MKTIVGLFDHFSEAEAVVRELERAGLDRATISVIANESARGGSRPSTTAVISDEGTLAAEGAGTGAVIGGVAGGMAGLIASLAGLAIPGVGPVIAAGPLVAALTGAGVGAVAGGLLGALTTAGVPEEHARYYEEGVRRGGTLVTVSASDIDADRVMEIMNRHNPVDIEERAAAWRTAGTRLAGPVADSERDVDPSDAERVRNRVYSHVPVGAADESTAAWDFDLLESDFRANFQQSFPGGDYTYDQVKPVYRYGHSLAGEHRDEDWNAVEGDARRRWEERNPGTWDKFRNAARYAWDRTREKVS